MNEPDQQRPDESEIDSKQLRIEKLMREVEARRQANKGKPARAIFEPRGAFGRPSTNPADQPAVPLSELEGELVSITVCTRNTFGDCDAIVEALAPVKPVPPPAMVNAPPKAARGNKVISQHKSAKNTPPLPPPAVKKKS